MYLWEWQLHIQNVHVAAESTTNNRVPVCMWHHQILKSKIKEPLKGFILRHIRGTQFISVSNFLQSSTKVLARLPTFAVSVREIYQFTPLPPIQCCLSWWSCHCSFPTLSGGKGVPYSSDAISYCFQNSLSTHVPVVWSRRAKDFCRGL